MSKTAFILAPDPSQRLSLDGLVAALRAAGETTRLRILVLLSAGDLTVTDLTAILGQSQPRISRHLKLLVEAGLIDRFPEGGWAYYRLSEVGGAALLTGAAAHLLDAGDPTLARDRERLDQVKHEHAEQAAEYFARNAGAWDRLRSLHVEAGAVEQAIVDAVGPRSFDAMLDLGTGTGRVLELLHGRYARAVGVDLSHDMLAAARAHLEAQGLTGVQLRQGDIYTLNLARESFDLVTIHQVLHYLDDPARAVREAARLLRPGGRMLIVDFAPHGLEFLREKHAHRRLGFAHSEIGRALEQAGLEVQAIRDLPAPGADKLTVTLWLARDPRVLMATNPSNQETVA